MWFADDLHNQSDHLSYFVLLAVVINTLYDDIDELEDELELAAEEAYLTEAALEDVEADADSAPPAETMEDLEKQK